MPQWHPLRMLVHTGTYEHHPISSSLKHITLLS